jgi:ribosomal protein S18 acetylase RimI-like enzyme
LTDIRLATPADLPAVQEIVETSYAQYIPLIGRRPAPMDADYAAAIEAGQLYVLGHPTLGCLVMFPDGDAIEIDMIAVLPEAQGQGIGRKLLDFAADHARSTRRSKLTLYTNAKMARNVVIYQKYGFTITHRATVDGFDRIFMEMAV